MTLSLFNIYSTYILLTLHCFPIQYIHMHCYALQLCNYDLVFISVQICSNVAFAYMINLYCLPALYIKHHYT